MMPRAPLPNLNVQGDANGLLDHDVLSSLECGNGLFRMKSGGGADRHCVDVGIGKYGVEVGRVAPGSTRLGQPAGAGLPGADDEAQRRHVRQTPDRLGVEVADHSGADDGEADNHV
jgi:hypothetical protein